MAGGANAREQDPKCKGAPTAPALSEGFKYKHVGDEGLKMNLVFGMRLSVGISHGARLCVVLQLRMRGSTALRTWRPTWQLRKRCDMSSASSTTR